MRNIFFILNNIANLLGHGCALALQNVEFPSVRAWNNAMLLQGSIYNDSLPSSEKCRSCIESWGYDHEKREVRWSTQMGRLTTTASIDRVELIFSTTSGKIFALFYWDADLGWHCTRLDQPMIADRPDRLSLLADLNSRLEGAILGDTIINRDRGFSDSSNGLLAYFEQQEKSLLSI